MKFTLFNLSFFYSNIQTLNDGTIKIANGTTKSIAIDYGYYYVSGGKGPNSEVKLGKIIVEGKQNYAYRQKKYDALSTYYDFGGNVYSGGQVIELNGEENIGFSISHGKTTGDPISNFSNLQISIGGKKNVGFLRASDFGYNTGAITLDGTKIGNTFNSMSVDMRENNSNIQSNIFMALMLVTFSTFYLIFLTMEGTAEIGQKGIRIIVIQSVTMFMTVAMMGISYQVLRLIAVDNSIQGIASLAIMLLMLEQVMENISTMATAITTGGTLGASKGDNFMGLMGSFGTMFAGMAMMGGAKYDELKNGGEETGSELFNKENNTKEDNRSSKYSDKEIMAKANRNVENEANGRYSGMYVRIKKGEVKESKSQKDDII